ncbi:uncharacterized protein LOC143434962 isoform X1 [Arvicanthis niloticus]|uniref:uncharacterized protein LOC143309293 isoform X1 n=1 Tax=Arvicanthis niloticus TaxID=61156 RepID=UPI00402B2DFE
MGFNFTYMNPRKADVNPFDQWLLCGVNGSCTDLSPLVMLGKGATAKGQLSFDWTGTLGGSLGKRKSGGSFSWQSANTKYTEFKSITFGPTLVCVWPPFVWIVSNDSFIWNETLTCAPNTCFFVLCWNATMFPFAMVTRLPRFVPVPVEAPNTLAHFRIRRDFGISAIIVGIIAGAAVIGSVTASALALSSSVQAADSINQLSASVTPALDVQASTNSQIMGGLMLVNQRIDLVQEQIDILWQLAQLGCEQKMPGLCITSIPYDNYTRTTNLSKVFSQFLLQNWTLEFEETLHKLRFAIIEVNLTRLDLFLTEGLSSWIHSAISFFKEWVGVGLFRAALCCGGVLLLWLVCKLKAQTKRDKVVVTQALTALEQGASPDIWLSMLRQ